MNNLLWSHLIAAHLSSIWVIFLFGSRSNGELLGASPLICAFNSRAFRVTKCHPKFEHVLGMYDKSKTMKIKILFIIKILIEKNTLDATVLILSWVVLKKYMYTKASVLHIHVLVWMLTSQSLRHMWVFLLLLDYIQPHATNQISVSLIIDWRKNRKGVRKK